jgi:menaquinone-dependent protoporphyrinogen IX oxidase
MKIQRFMEINKIIVGSNVKILKWHINFQSINKVLGTQLPQTMDRVFCSTSTAAVPNPKTQFSMQKFFALRWLFLTE